VILGPIFVIRIVVLSVKKFEPSLGSAGRITGMNLTTKSHKALFPIGVGTWTIGGLRTAESGNEDVEIEAIRYSLSKGQNHIDTAQLYGGFHTDEIVGKAVSRTEREELFIADKLWKTSVGKGLVKPTVDAMLSKLGTDYIDLLYIHAPWEDAPWQEAIPQIDTLIDKGIVRYFGVSNFTVGHMKQAAALSKHRVAANQMNFNVLHQQEADGHFRSYCKDNGIQLVAYQPVKRRDVLTNKVVRIIAKNHQATPAQVALAWLLELDAMPIPKATNKQHIDENAQAINLRLTRQEMELLGELAVAQ
jgi:diketogulonate reductase-like aldo/keto reductase